ncbi:MAG: ATP-binding protein, partial [bacterium]
MEELSLHILDLVQNSIRAAATRVEILIEEHIAEDLFLFEVKDNGQGMAGELV